MAHSPASMPCWGLLLLLFYQTALSTPALLDTKLNRYLFMLKKEERKAVQNWIEHLDSLTSKNSATTTTFEIKEEPRFDTTEIASAFPDACVILTGETGTFDFDRIPQVPYILNAGGAAAKRLRNASTQIVASSRTVRQQLIIQADDILTSPGEIKPKLELFPLTVAVVNTKLPYMSVSLPPLLNAVAAFSIGKDALVYYVRYDVSIAHIVDIQFICNFCEQREQVVAYSGLGHGVSHLRPNQRNAGELMHLLRGAATNDGEHTSWTINHVFSQSSLASLRERWSNPGEERKTYFDADLGLYSAVFQTLFPRLNRTIFRKNETFSQFCIIKSHSSILDCSYSSPQARTMYTFINVTQEKLKEEDIIFISSEKTKEAGGITAADMFLKVISTEAWIILLFSVLSTSTICVVYEFITEGCKNLRMRSTPLVPEMRRFTGAVFYFLVGFLAQYNKDLPVEGTRLVYMVRWLVFPWLILHLLLPIWYTSFLQISFSFTHPYQLETQSWEDFENYSVYFMEQESYAQFVVGNYFHHTAIMSDVFERLVADVNNFNDSRPLTKSWEITRNPKDYCQKIQNPWYSSKYSKADVCHYFFGPSRFTLSMSDAPILVWFKDKLNLLDRCIEQKNASRESNQGSLDQCEKDVFKIWKMIVRHEHIIPSELYLYVGQRYRDAIQTARRQGMQLMKRMIELEEKWDKDNDKAKMNSSLCSISKNFSEGWSCENYVRAERAKWFQAMEKNISSTHYWMVKRPEAVFMVTRIKFPWYWILFRKSMRMNPSIKFAHTGPISLRQKGREKSLGGNGFEPPVQVQGPLVTYLPEMKSLLWRIRVLSHSGILGLYTKWGMLLHLPYNKTDVDQGEEVMTEASALTMEDVILQYAFGMLGGAAIISTTTFLVEKMEDRLGSWDKIVLRVGFFLVMLNYGMKHAFQSVTFSVGKMTSRVCTGCEMLKCWIIGLVKRFKLKESPK